MCCTDLSSSPNFTSSSASLARSGRSSRSTATQLGQPGTPRRWCQASAARSPGAAASLANCQSRTLESRFPGTRSELRILDGRGPKKVSSCTTHPIKPASTRRWRLRTPSKPSATAQRRPARHATPLSRGWQANNTTCAPTTDGCVFQSPANDLPCADRQYTANIRVGARADRPPVQCPVGQPMVARKRRQRKAAMACDGGHGAGLVLGARRVDSRAQRIRRGRARAWDSALGGSVCWGGVVGKAVAVKGWQPAARRRISARSASIRFDPGVFSQ